MTTLDMDKICSLLADKGIKSYVEQTGGGTATIYAGNKTPHEFIATWDGNKPYTEDRWEACAGPGWFEGPGWSNGRADTSEFYVGLDDDGQSDICAVAHDRWDEARAAQAIADLIMLVRGAKA